ncbi:MAG: hypothetical protein IPK13_22640 [Deltaproteobacteria bacterium]|nr:hypothetical protein [Deltaproteobacteria bacterium]
MNIRRDESHGRLRAAFGIGIGAFALVAGIAARLFSLTGRAGEPVLGLDWAVVGVALALAAVMSSWIARPRRDVLLMLGLLPLTALLGLVMAIWGLMDDDVLPTFVHQALTTTGGFALVFSAVRFARARVDRIEMPSASFDRKRKVRLRKPGEKKRAQVAVGSLARGDVYELSPGEDIPVDSTILEGSGFVDESSLFGAELPVAKKPGDYVFAGTFSTVPELVLRAERGLDESLVAVGDRLRASCLQDLASPGKEMIGAAIGIAVVAVGAIVALFVVRSDQTWLDLIPMLAGMGLASLSAVPSLRKAKLWSDLAILSRAHGVIVSRAKDLEALAYVRRWQLDPNLLAAPGQVEAVALGDLAPDEVIRIAAALIEHDDTPELLSLRAFLKKKHLTPLAGAALRKEQSVFHGTVTGHRWVLGPQQALRELEGIELDVSAEGPVEFLRGRGLITWVLARRDERGGVFGILGIGVESHKEAADVARSLEATLLPGLPDTTRRSIAEAAGIRCDGAPLEARDGSLLLEKAPTPSAGLRIRVVRPAPGLRISETEASRLLDPALPGFGHFAAAAKRLRRQASIDVAILGVGAPMIAVVLAWLDVLGGLSGTLIGVSSVWLSGRPIVGGRRPGSWRRPRGAGAPRRAREARPARKKSHPG